MAAGRLPAATGGTSAASRNSASAFARGSRFHVQKRSGSSEAPAHGSEGDSRGRRVDARRLSSGRAGTSCARSDRRSSTVVPCSRSPGPSSSTVDAGCRRGSSSEASTRTARSCSTDASTPSAYALFSRVSGSGSPYCQTHTEAPWTVSGEQGSPERVQTPCFGLRRRAAGGNRRPRPRTPPGALRQPGTGRVVRDTSQHPFGGPPGRRPERSRSRRPDGNARRRTPGPTCVLHGATPSVRGPASTPGLAPPPRAPGAPHPSHSPGQSSARSGKPGLSFTEGPAWRDVGLRILLASRLRVREDRPAPVRHESP